MNSLQTIRFIGTNLFHLLVILPFLLFVAFKRVDRRVYPYTYYALLAVILFGVIAHIYILYLKFQLMRAILQ